MDHGHLGLGGRPSPRQRAVTLFLVVAVLSLLSILSLTFVAVAKVERNASRNYADLARAKMLADAGLEAAISHLRDVTLNKDHDDPRDPWVYKDQAGTGVGGGIDLPIALNPSYNAGTAHGLPYSGLMSSTYVPQGDSYLLKILDGASQVYLNGPQPSLSRMLDTLGMAIADYASKQGQPAVDPIRGRGAQIIALRQSLGGAFKGKEELIGLLGRDDFERVRDFVTVWTWVDPSTVAPDPANAGPEGVPGWKHEPRAPVNVNTAAWPVLVSVLTDLADANDPAITYDQAGRIADELIRARTSTAPGEGPFASWPQFYDFVDGVVTRLAILSQGQADCLKADANPNTMLNCFNAERVINPRVDKLHLTYLSTEMVFRSMGTYEITSMGRVVGSMQGDVVAESAIRTTIQIYSVFYHTTQADFESGRTSDLTDNTDTFPENLTDLRGKKPAEYDGHIQLFTAQRSSVAPTATITFQADYTGGYEPSIAVGNVGAASVALTTKQHAIPLLQGSDLMADGTYGNEARREWLGYPSPKNFPVDQGSMELWVKFDRNPNLTMQPVFFGTNSLTSEAGVQTDIQGAIYNGSLSLESSRTFYTYNSYDASNPPTYPVPYAYRKTTVTAQIAGYGQSSEWHHLVLEWLDGTDQRLYVDGQLFNVTSYTLANDPNVTSLPGLSPRDDRFYLGGRPDAGNVYLKNMTIDNIRIYNTPTIFPAPGFIPPDRFQRADPIYVGHYSGGFQPLGYPIRIGPIIWTEWIPKEYNGRSLMDISSTVDFGLGVGGDGKKKEDHDGRRDDSDYDGHDDHHHDDHHHDDHHGGGNGGEVIIPVGGNGSGSNQLVPLGLPEVIVASTQISYSIDFVIPVTLVPLNVTPAVDDVMIMYQGPLKFLSYEVIIGR